MTAIYPGSFAPPTLGHWDVIQRASKLFKKLYVAVACNTAKQQDAFTVNKRTLMLGTLCAPLQNVEIVACHGLVVDLAAELKADVLVRGLRCGSDFDKEEAYAQMNRAMSGIETLFIPSAPEYRGIRSSLVREVASYGGCLKEFVPEIILEEVQKNFQ